MNISVKHPYNKEIISDVNSVTHLHAIPQLQSKIMKGILFIAVRLIPFEFQIRTEYLAWYSALVVSYRHQDEENRNQIGVRLGSQKKIVRLRKSLRWRTILRGSVEGIKPVLGEMKRSCCLIPQLGLSLQSKLFFSPRGKMT